MTKNKIQIRCIHRHTIDEHPSCFVKGLINYDFENDRDWEKTTGMPWYQYPEYKIGYFDIEADSLKANFGTVLSWCIKEKGGDIVYDVINQEDLLNGMFDERVVESFIEEISKYKIIIGYYSTNYDLPFMRTKAMMYNKEFPGYGEIYHWDLYYTVRNKMSLHRNSLDMACAMLGIKGKTHIDWSVWRKAKYGDKKALQEVLYHNKEDVNITEKLHDRLEFTRKWIRKSI